MCSCGFLLFGVCDPPAFACPLGLIGSVAVDVVDQLGRCICCPVPQAFHILVGLALVILHAGDRGFGDLHFDVVPALPVLVHVGLGLLVVPVLVAWCLLVSALPAASARPLVFFLLPFVSSVVVTVVFLPAASPGALCWVVVLPVPVLVSPVAVVEDPLQPYVLFALPCWVVEAAFHAAVAISPVHVESARFFVRSKRVALAVVPWSVWCW